MVDLIIWLIVGAAAGWIAGIVIKGAGFWPLGNIVGILGAIVAGFIFPLLGIAFLPGLIGDVVYAAIGAINTTLPYPGSASLNAPQRAKWYSIGMPAEIIDEPYLADDYHDSALRKAKIAAANALLERGRG